MNIYVGNVSFKMNDDDLREAFEAHGEVSSASIVMDRDTGRSRGFGFVTFEQDDEAMEAMERMNGTALDGRNITVNEARERSPRRGGGGGGGRRNSRW